MSVQTVQLIRLLLRSLMRELSFLFTICARTLFRIQRTWRGQKGMETFFSLGLFRRGTHHGKRT